MKTLLCFFTSALFLFAASTDSGAEKQVLAAMDAYKRAMIEKDGATLGKLLSDDLTYVHSGGQLERKADTIGAITSGKTIVEDIKYSDMSVRVYGKTALVRANVDLQHSKTNIVHMNVLHVWVDGPNGWQMTARQATRLTDK